MHSVRYTSFPTSSDRNDRTLHLLYTLFNHILTTSCALPYFAACASSNAFSSPCSSISAGPKLPARDEASDPVQENPLPEERLLGDRLTEALLALHLPTCIERGGERRGMSQSNGLRVPLAVVDDKEQYR